jgi:flagellar motor switch protein FliM
MRNGDVLAYLTIILPVMGSIVVAFLQVQKGKATTREIKASTSGTVEKIDLLAEKTDAIANAELALDKAERRFQICMGALTLSNSVALAGGHQNGSLKSAQENYMRAKADLDQAEVDFIAAMIHIRKKYDKLNGRGRNEARNTEFF